MNTSRLERLIELKRSLVSMKSASSLVQADVRLLDTSDFKHSFNTATYAQIDIMLAGDIAAVEGQIRKELETVAHALPREEASQCTSKPE